MRFMDWILSKTSVVTCSDNVKSISKLPVWVLIHAFASSTNWLICTSWLLLPTVWRTLYFPSCLSITWTQIFPLSFFFANKHQIKVLTLWDTQKHPEKSNKTFKVNKLFFNQKKVRKSGESRPVLSWAAFLFLVRRLTSGQIFRILESPLPCF